MYIDTDSSYMLISALILDDVIKPELITEYEVEKCISLATGKYIKRTPGLFKVEFLGFRMIAMRAKRYCVEGKDDTKYSCMGISQKRNQITWKYYKAGLEGSTDKTSNH